MKIRKFIATSLALFAALYVIGQCLAACTPPTAAEKQVGAAALYEEQQRACVEQYADTAHIDACRAKVKAAWATCPVAGGCDAGKDGAP